MSNTSNSMKTSPFCTNCGKIMGAVSSEGELIEILSKNPNCSRCDAPFEVKRDGSIFNIDFKNIDRINPKIWIYIERLYIHCYGADEFIKYLRNFGIPYNNKIYSKLDDTTTGYTFMSEENYDFANFMQNVTSYTYLDILKDLIFNDLIINTKNSNWNYYGEGVKEWYPKVIELLESDGFTIDFNNEKLIFGEKIIDFWGIIHKEIINISKKKFEDGHYSDAVESAFKEVNTRVKKLFQNKTGKELDGRDLMFQSFRFKYDKNNNVITDDPVIFLTDLTSESKRNIQEGYNFIFGGAIQGIRNPKAHGNIKIGKDEAIHYIFVSSLLMYKLDKAS
ncbi:MAG: TIGR02391 family protein [Methanobacterium sp.]|uniref:TIGR02391 family protein n=1 Tax=Methanobacterium sp. TaxID=2164 RepID=UPI003D65AEC6|nr:TIGR02391 family protein [Methanobacterium sp.]